MAKANKATPKQTAVGCLVVMLVVVLVPAMCSLSPEDPVEEVPAKPETEDPGEAALKLIRSRQSAGKACDDWSRDLAETVANADEEIAIKAVHVGAQTCNLAGPNDLQIPEGLEMPERKPLKAVLNSCGMQYRTQTRRLLKLEKLLQDGARTIETREAKDALNFVTTTRRNCVSQLDEVAELFQGKSK